MPADFTWNRLLSYDACVSCGRCETACPAFGLARREGRAGGLATPAADAGVVGQEPVPGEVRRHLDLDAPRLGAEMPADFTWNRLLSYDACVSCGRCETACPAMGDEVQRAGRGVAHRPVPHLEGQAEPAGGRQRQGFAGRPDTALQPLDLDAPRLGAEMPADFTWNRLLSYGASARAAPRRPGRARRRPPAPG
jgi:Fe-S oxidoreductase